MDSHEKVASDGKDGWKCELLWKNIFFFVLLHFAAAGGLYLMLTTGKWQTLLFACALHIIGGFGVTAGAHRLWAHRSYRANLPLRTLLMLLNCITLQNDVISWARDHRVHHKWSETSADPHDARRGLIFSHIGWLCSKKHPEVIRKGRSLDMQDLYSDRVLTFQRRYYKILGPALCFLLPTIVPMWFWGEEMLISFLGPGCARYCFTLHATWTVNSLAHLHGTRPYNSKINPAQNIISILMTIGEGWHNFHHTFPVDYRASEFPWLINITTIFIDAMVWIGWAYDTRTVQQEVIENRKRRNIIESH